MVTNVGLLHVIESPPFESRGHKVHVRGEMYSDGEGVNSEDKGTFKGRSASFVLCRPIRFSRSYDLFVCEPRRICFGSSTTDYKSPCLQSPSGPDRNSHVRRSPPDPSKTVKSLSGPDK